MFLLKTFFKCPPKTKTLVFFNVSTKKAPRPTAILCDTNIEMNITPYPQGKSSVIARINGIKNCI